MSVRASVFASELALRESGGKRRTLGGFLHTVAYGLWLGGLITLGIFVPINATHLMHTNPIFAADPAAQKALLIGIIGNSFRLFNKACYIYGAVMLLGDLLQSSAAESGYRQFTGARSFFTLILLLTAAYLGYLLFPEMDAARLHAHMVYFDHLHKRYELISELQLIPLTIIPALTARRDRALDARF